MGYHSQAAWDAAEPEDFDRNEPVEIEPNEPEDFADDYFADQAEGRWTSGRGL